MLELIHHMISISECSRKILVAFDFDEKLAQITMWYHISKDFLCLGSAVDQVLLFSGHDLGSGRMLCKQKY